MNKHVADESSLSEIINVWLPSLLGLIVFGLSLYADIKNPSSSWTQRSGNLIIVIGAYIGYHETKQSLKSIEGDLYLNPELFYKVLAAMYVIVGTTISGYGDLIVRYFLGRT